MLKVAIIILNWEDAPATLACAASVLDEMKRCGDIVHSQLFVVDNGSGDDSVDAFRAWVQGVPNERV